MWKQLIGYDLCLSIIMKSGHHILLVLKEAMSLTFERSINLLENVTLSNICNRYWTQSCPLFRGVRYSEVSAIQRCPLFRVRYSVRYSDVCPLFRGPLYRGVRYSELFAIQRCPLSAIQRCPLFRGFRIRFCTKVPDVSISAIGSFYCIHL